MTQKEFLEKLSRMRRKWVMSPPEHPVKIRCETKKRTFCPLTAVAHAINGKSVNMVDYIQAAEQIGVSKILALKIVAAADYRPEEKHFDPKLRVSLLAACMLEETAVQKLPKPVKAEPVNPIIKHLAAKAKKKAPAKMKAKAKSKK